MAMTRELSLHDASGEALPLPPPLARVEDAAGGCAAAHGEPA